MSKFLRKSIVTMLAAGYCTGFALKAQGQHPGDSLSDLTAEILKQATTSAGHAPERGHASPDAFKNAKATKKFNFAFNRHLSILVTDVDTVSEIKFSEVMGQFVKQNKDRGGDQWQTREMLFHQWWDTANKKPGLATGPHCDDSPPQDSEQDIYRCPRREGNEATNTKVFTDEPDGDNAYSAVAFVNRFDLYSPSKQLSNGQVEYPDCGEYRVIFARNSGKTIGAQSGPDGNGGPAPTKTGVLTNRNLISFEARVANPTPRQSASAPPAVGCLPILTFWYSLSDPEMNGKERGKRLREFFLNGKMTGTGGSIDPVIDIKNFFFKTGQIRTNQFLANTVTNVPAQRPSSYGPGIPASMTIDPNDWTLREFRTFVAADGTLLIVPDTTKSTPATNLFKPGTIDPRLTILTKAIRDQIRDVLGGGTALGEQDINSIKFATLSVGANAFESDESKQAEGDIVSVYNNSVLFTAAIQDDLNNVNSNLTPANVIDRIRTQTCAGCHQYSDTQVKVGSNTFGFDTETGLGGRAHWPTKACGDVDATCVLPAGVFIVKTADKHPPMQFTQVSEMILTPSIADKGKRWRYAISTTVECMLDYREAVIEQALGVSQTIASHCPAPH
jgi:hypothetical protein